MIRIPAALLAKQLETSARLAQGLLPDLVHRLIKETSWHGTLKEAGFPSGDQIRQPGWDGKTQFFGDSPYIPGGSVGWEIGTGDDPRSKAHEDFKKRSEDPLGLDPSESTFVFVTSRVWSRREEWRLQAEQDGPWSSVRVYDATELSAWLETAPNTTLWLARALNLYGVGWFEAQFYWERCALGPPRPDWLTEKIALLDRTTQQGELLRWLAEPSGQLEVIADSRAEAGAFVAAVVLEIDQDANGPAPVLFAIEQAEVPDPGLLTNVVVAIDHDSPLRKQLLRLPEPPSLIVLGARASLPNVYAGSDSGPILLPRHSVGLLTDQLRDFVDSSDVAYRAAKACRGSLEALTLELSPGNMSGEPSWLRGDRAVEVAPLVLLGDWDVNNAADRKVAQELLGGGTAGPDQLLASLAEPGGPVERRADHWSWRAWRVYWSRLAEKFGPDVLERFEKLAIEVLATPDPVAIDPRPFVAPVDRHPNSELLRKSIVGSLCLLAVQRVVHKSDAAPIPARVVRQLLGSQDGFTNWSSLASVLPDLAEAAPEEFLQALGRDLNQEGFRNAIFPDSNPWFSGLYVHLVWALQRLAFAEEHVAMAFRLLVKMAELDPGGNNHPRPSGALANLVLPWLPAAGTPLDDCEKLIEGIVTQYPEQAWVLVCGSLPSTYAQTSFPFADPEWRSDAWRKKPSRATTYAEFGRHLEWVVDFLFRHANADPSRWCFLVEHSNDLFAVAPSRQAEFLELLKSPPRSAWSEKDDLTYREAARAIVAKHEAFPDAKWRAQEDVLELMREVAAANQPVGLRASARYLFDRSPDRYRDREGTYQEQRERFELAQREAVRGVLDAEGEPGILSWATEVDDPRSLGWTVGRADEDRALESTMTKRFSDSESDPVALLARGYLCVAIGRNDTAWSDDVLQEYASEGDRDRAIAFALLRTADPDLWSLLESIGGEIRDAYWDALPAYQCPGQHAPEVVEGLLSRGRWHAAMEFVAGAFYAPRDGDGERIATLTEQARAILSYDVQEPADGSSPIDPHYLGRLFDVVRSAGASHEELRQWEWQWFGYIEAHHGVPELQRWLATDTEFFCELLCMRYPSAIEPDPFDTVIPDQVRYQASQLLEIWSRVPGLDHGSAEGPSGLRAIEDRYPDPVVSGAVDEDKLRAWVNQALVRAERCGRRKAALIRIGAVFAFAPADQDGAWPCKPVRTMIEELESETLETQFCCEVSNRRGVHNVGRTGDAEREIADRFDQWAKQISLEAPRTASALRGLASGFRSDGAGHDERGRDR
ncbi:MAG: hypothetical protein AAGB51_14070 [Planctomycetota bacterium]